MNDKLDIERHMWSFAKTFILEGRRDKWVSLLCDRPDNIFIQSAKFFNHLDHNYMEQNDLLNDVAPDETVGVFYDFNNEPKCISFKEAVEEGKGHDALFSISPGELAVCFFHDGWNFVCKR